MHHTFDTPEWLGSTGFYFHDLRSPLDRNERGTWAPICVWAAPGYSSSTMSVTFEASTGSYEPPADRQYLLELLSVPDGVVGAPAVGTVWELPLLGLRTVNLPTYRTTEGMTGYQFAFTITEAQPGPGDLDNDGDVDQDDLVVFERCLAGPGGEVGSGCTPENFTRSNINGDDYVDLADFSLFAIDFTGLLVSRPTYVGAPACMECHAANYDGWAQTLHATAFDTLVEGGEEDNPACLSCHAVGYGSASGYIDLETTPHLADVQCENCHGPGSHHAADADNVSIAVDLDSAMCGECHRSCHGMCGDYYHPHYEQWSASKHSKALVDVRWLPEYEQSCLECHSTDYRLAPEGEKPPATEASYSVECVACHAPHGSDNDHQLRLAAESLCAQCHTMGDAGPGDSPDQPHAEFLHGVGGFALDGSSLDGLYLTPFTSLDGECVYCHVYREDYTGPDQPANSGHTFEANTRACTACHLEVEAFARIASVQLEVGHRLAAIALFFDPDDPYYIDPATLTPEQLVQYNIAKFGCELIEADGTLGVHNAPFARRLLEEAETCFGIAP